MDIKARTEALKEKFIGIYGAEEKKAALYSSILAESEIEEIVRAVDLLIEEEAETNVTFAGSGCTLMLEKVYGISYPEALMIAEEVMEAMVQSAKNAAEITVWTTDGSRCVFTPRIIRSDGTEVDIGPGSPEDALSDILRRITEE